MMDKMTPVISYIVSVYNTESFLNECIDSIIKQNIENREIILVDDGSTDKSREICDDYEKKYDFIYVIRGKNGGVSSARNVGLAKAQGKYICFVDSDDFFQSQFSEEFIELCEKERLDIIRGCYGIFDDSTQTFLPHPYPQIPYVETVLSGSEFLEKSVSNGLNEVVPWLGFFRREYLIKHEIRFPEGISFEEDQLFFLDSLLCDPNCRVMQVSSEFYAYRKRSGSATKSPSLKHAEDVLFIVNEEVKLIRRYDFLSRKTVKAAKRYICSSFYQLTSIYGRVGKTDKKKIAQMTPFWMKWMGICYPYDRHQQIKIILFTFARWAVDIVYKWRNN